MFILQYIQKENNLEKEYIVLFWDKPTKNQKELFCRDGYRLHREYEFLDIHGAEPGLPMERELVVE